jgi:hypothetical protein
VGLFADVLDQLQADPDVRPGAMFGHRCAKIGRKVFAIDFDGDLVVKLGADRVAEMAHAGEAAQFEPMAGRPMGGWAQVPPADGGNPVAAWVALAEEAKAEVAARA